ncbi:MAG: hypothetical protein JWP89_5498 [Schlesneria sp.]|nr:hypothetical protein [Schlesneria sp.]
MIVASMMISNKRLFFKAFYRSRHDAVDHVVDVIHFASDL